MASLSHLGGHLLTLIHQQTTQVTQIHVLEGKRSLNMKGKFELKENSTLSHGGVNPTGLAL